MLRLLCVSRSAASALTLPSAHEPKRLLTFPSFLFLMERKSLQHIYPRFSSENQSRIPSHKLFQELLCFRAFYEKIYTCNDPLPNLSCLCTKTLWSLDGYNGANRRRGKFFVQKFLSSRGKWPSFVLRLVLNLALCPLSNTSSFSV